MAIAEMDITQISTLVQTALCNGASISTITTQIEQAFKGIDHPCIISAWALDISTLIYRISGRPLLYAMNHALGPPFLRTLQNHLSFIRVMPTVGDITHVVVDHNMQEVLVKPVVGSASDMLSFTRSLSKRLLAISGIQTWSAASVGSILVVS